MRELFIYYRVHLDHAAAAEAMVRAMQAALAHDHPQLRARLLHRSPPQGCWQTWMETYSTHSHSTDPMQDTQGITDRLAAEIESRAAALTPYIDGARHVEVFVACAW
jgi:LmbE family N-acetylglucosaminyl deacetylase